MADQNITELPVKTSSGMTSSDYMLGIDSAEGYQMLIKDLGDYIIRNVQVNTIAGANQTLKSALDTLNSKPDIDSGKVIIPKNSGTGVITITVQFHKTFSKEPNICATFNENLAGNPQNVFENLEIGIFSVTTTDFKISVKCLINSSYDWLINWIAIAS